MQPGSYILGRCLHLAEFVFGNRGAVVLDQPHVKLFEDAAPGVDGILFAIVSEPVLRSLEFSLRCVDIRDGVGFEMPQDLSPADKSVDDFVDPAKSDVNAGLLLNHKLPH